MTATPMTGKKGPEYIQPEDIAEAAIHLTRLSLGAWPVEIVIDRKSASK